MLTILVENSSYKKTSGKDSYGAKFFMQEYFKKNNIFLVFGSIHNYDKSKNKFTSYYTIHSNGTQTQTNKSITPDIIWNRKNSGTTYKYEILKEFTIIPCLKIANIGNDKYENYLFLQKYQPKTFLLHTFFTNTIAQKELTDKIVLKPLRANGGKGILLLGQKELLERRKEYLGLEELYVVQSFKDFSEGYPGLIEGNHDVRCMFAGKNIIETTIRIPKLLDFRSNIGSGGKQISISKNMLPTDLSCMIKNIYEELNITDRNIFSMDFAYCKEEGKRYLIEINTSPGTWYYQEDKQKLTKICAGLVSFFLSLK